MAQRDVPPDGVFVPEALASGGLVNDCDKGAGLVVQRKITTDKKWCAIRLEIGGSNVIDLNLIHLLRMIFRKCDASGCRALHWTHAADGGGAYARNGVQPRHQFFRELRELRRVITTVREIKRD